MQFSPGFHKAALPLGQVTCEQFYLLINRIHAGVVSLVGMEMRPVMLHSRLCIHPHDNAEEARDFRHSPLSFTCPSSRLLRLFLSLVERLHCTAGWS